MHTVKRIKKRQAIDWEKYLQTCCILIQKTCIQNKQRTFKLNNKKQTNFIGRKRSEQTSYQQRYTDGKRAHEKLLNIICHRES